MFFRESCLLEELAHWQYFLKKLNFYSEKLAFWQHFLKKS